MHKLTIPNSIYLSRILHIIRYDIITYVHFNNSIFIPIFNSTASIVVSFSRFLLTVINWPALLNNLSTSADVGGIARTSNAITDNSGKSNLWEIHQALISVMLVSHGD